jgi:hypothetical protein
VLLGLGTALVYPTLIAAIGDVVNPRWRASAVVYIDSGAILVMQSEPWSPVWSLISSELRRRSA